MPSACDIVFLHALSPVHVGSGSSVDIIDLPLVREHATGYPVIPGSSLKGSLRALVHGRNQPALEAEVFGNAKGDSDAADSFAGAVAFSDARLLLLPVRSSRGVFVFATGAIALRRFLRLLVEVAPGKPVVKALSSLVREAARLDEKSPVLVAKGGLLAGGGRWFLEDLEVTATTEDGDLDTVGKFLAEHVLAGEDDYLTGRLAVLPDDVFQYFTEQATEVAARVRIDPDRRTVKSGGLWNEENLPAETLLFAMTQSFGARQPNVARAGRAIIDDLWADARHLVHTFGGKETVGHGRVRLSRVKGEV